MTPIGTLFTALAWMMGLFVSPEALILQGNLAGRSGFGFILPLAFVLALHGLNAAGSNPAPAGEIRFLVNRWGPSTAAFLLLMARPALAVCLATAVLVSAGFVFNEVFLYWFPNFGFAALLLAILWIINWAGSRAAAVAQVLFTATAVVAMLAIALAGLLGGDLPVATGITISPGMNGRNAALAALAFIGYDMLRYASPDNTNRRSTCVVPVGLVAGGILFALWNSAALLHVEPQRLAQTSIPHLLTAKAILGPAGRIAIGLVVIAGACAAVNYLLGSVARMLAVMAQQRLLPAILGHSAERPAAALTVLTAAAGLLMATGFAGSDWLDTSIRAALLLWLAFYAMVHLSALFPEQTHGRTVGRSGGTLRKLRHAALSFAMILLAIVAGAAGGASLSLLKAIAAMLTAAAALAAAGRLTARRLAPPPEPYAPQLSKGEMP